MQITVYNTLYISGWMGSSTILALGEDPVLPCLRFFLCSMDTFRPLPTCRNVFERARLGCLPVMQKYGFEWPKRMSCSKLPEYGGSQLCMDAQAQDTKDLTHRLIQLRTRHGSLTVQLPAILHSSLWKIDKSPSCGWQSGPSSAVHQSRSHSQHT